MKKWQSIQRKQRGFTLVEMGIVAVVVAGLLVAVFMLVPKMKTDRMLASGRQEVPLVVSALRAAFIGQTSTVGLTSLTAVGTGAFQGRVYDTKNIRYPGPKGTTWFEYVFSNKTLALPMVTREGGAIIYWMAGVPQNMCLPMMQLLAAQPGVSMVYAGTGTPSDTIPATMLPGASKVDPSGLVLEVASAGAACAGKSNAVAALIAI
jgi:prepilin-type N-terminal cleavage/methylation domain-containing protein